MNPQEIEDLLTDFTNVLNQEQPLDLSNPEDEKRYVVGLHGGTDAVARLRRDIRSARKPNPSIPTRPDKPKLSANAVLAATGSIA